MSKLSNFLRRIFRLHPYWYPNKTTRKMLREEADRLIGYDKTVNPCWKKSSWKYFIKRQYPWYGIIELNQFKIIEMRDYMQNHSWLEEESTQKQIKQMTEVIELGNKILADEYENEAHKWYRENSVQITLVSRVVKGDNFKEKLEAYKSPEVKLYNTDLFDEIISDTSLEPLDCDISEEAVERLVNYLQGKDTRKLDAWLKDNNLTRKDITTAYTSEWINGKSDEENKKHWEEMFEEAVNDRKADISKYFESIGDYYDHWGD